MKESHNKIKYEILSLIFDDSERDRERDVDVVLGLETLGFEIFQNGTGHIFGCVVGIDMLLYFFEIFLSFFLCVSAFFNGIVCLYF